MTFWKKVFQFNFHLSFYSEIYVIYIVQKSFVDTFPERRKIIISLRVHFPSGDKLPVDFVIDLWHPYADR